MDFQPQKPIREFRFKLTLRYKNGEESEVQLTADQDDSMDALLQQLRRYIVPEYPVANIIIDVGDRRERWVPKGQEPTPGIQTIQDVV